MSRGSPQDDDAVTVLVVDDEPALRQVVALLLRRDGYRVLEAEDGQAAVSMVEQHARHIRLVVLDVMMPTMTGPEALPLMRRHVPGMPVIFFSGYDRSQIADHLHDPGAFTEFVGKPFDNQAFLDMVGRGIAASGDDHGTAGTM